MFGFVEKALVYIAREMKNRFTWQVREIIVITITTLVHFLCQAPVQHRKFMQTDLSRLNMDSDTKISQITFEMGKGKYCFPLGTFMFSSVFSLTFTLQAEPSILTSLQSFLYFPFNQFTMNCRLCQLLALYLKCHHPETWTGFQTFFEYQHSN